MTIETRLDKAEDELRDARRVARKRGNHEEELTEAAQQIRAFISDKREHRKELDKVEDVDQRERIADKIDVLEGDLAQVLAQLVRVERRSEKADKLLKQEIERVKRLEAKQAAIAAQQGQISKNFYRAEFNCHEGDPCPSYMDPHLKELAIVFLEPMRAEFGVAHCNSGHRWRWYNAKIGGALNSYHEYEQRKADPAADMVFATGTPAQWATKARALANAKGIGGVGQYNASGFVHIDPGPRRDWSG